MNDALAILGCIAAMAICWGLLRRPCTHPGLDLYDLRCRMCGRNTYDIVMEARSRRYHGNAAQSRG